MARQRFIWPDLWTDPVIGRLDSDAALFFIGCFSNADDDGRLLADPAYLRSTIFPYRDFSVSEVEAIRDRAIAACDNLTLYEALGKTILQFDKWPTYQKPKYPKPSKLPPPRNRKPAPLSQKPSGKTSEHVEEASGNPPGSLGEASVTGLGWVGLGSKPPLPPSRGARLTRKQREQQELAAEQAATHAKHLVGCRKFIALVWDEYTLPAILEELVGSYKLKTGEAQSLIDEYAEAMKPADEEHDAA